MSVTISFYKKHLVFWSVIGLVFWGGWSFFNRQVGLADINRLIGPDASAYQIKVDITKNGTVTVDDKEVKKAIAPQAQTDLLRLVLLDKTGFWLGGAQTVVTLPANVNINQVKITPRLVHSSNTAVSVTALNKSQVLLTASDIDPKANFSIEVEFPKGAIDLPALTRQAAQLNNQSIYWWLAIASLLPFTSIIVLLVILAQKYRIFKYHNPVEKLNSPPKNYPAPIVEVLMRGRVSARSITSTLVDLARRGYIYIGADTNNFIFGKNKQFKMVTPGKVGDDNISGLLYEISRINDATDLNYYERLILSKIFTYEDTISDRKEFEQRLGARLFSEKMAQVYEEIYKLATKENLFVHNPEQLHLKFKFAGLILWFTSIVGFFLGAIYFSEPKVTILFWIGMMVVANLIIKLAPSIPIFSPKGMEAYKKWINFRAYLTDANTFRYSPDIWAEFEKYLPYAIVLGVERQWSARFRDLPFSQPNWFDNQSDENTLESFDSALFPMISWVGKHLSIARTPSVD